MICGKFGRLHGSPRGPSKAVDTMRMPGGDPGDRSRLRLRALTDVPVPAVPWSAGSRVMVVLSVAVSLLGLAFLGLTFFSAAPLLDVVGAAETSTAVVTKKTYHPVFKPRRAGTCDFYRFDVAWDDREGMFTVCDNPDQALTKLEVGDEIVVTSVPWASEVSPEGKVNGLFWAVVGLTTGVWLVWLGVAWVRRYHRLVRGVATGVRLAGQVVECNVSAMRVRLATPGLAGGYLVMLPAKKLGERAEGETVEMWSSRRSALLRRPSGPWVVRTRRSEIVFTHARYLPAKPDKSRM